MSHGQGVTEVNLGIVKAREAEPVKGYGHRLDSGELAGIKVSAVEKLHEFDLGGWNKSDKILNGCDGAGRGRGQAEVEEIRRYLHHIRRLLSQVPAIVGLVEEVDFSNTQ